MTRALTRTMPAPVAAHQVRMLIYYVVAVALAAAAVVSSVIK